MTVFENLVVAAAFAVYLLMLGAIAIVVMLWAPQGIWGWVAQRYGWQMLPLERRLKRPMSP